MIKIVQQINKYKLLQNVTSHIHQSGNSTLTIGGSYFSYFSCDSHLNMSIIESTFQFYNDIALSSPNNFKDKYSSQGLGLILSCSNIHISVIQSRFLGFQNTAGKGGNFLLILSNGSFVNSNNYIVTISNCHFESGHALEGGGAFVSAVQPHFIQKLNVPVYSSPIKQKNCQYFTHRLLK